MDNDKAQMLYAFISASLIILAISYFLIIPVFSRLIDALFNLIAPGQYPTTLTNIWALDQPYFYIILFAPLAFFPFVVAGLENKVAGDAISGFTLFPLLIGVPIFGTISYLIFLVPGTPAAGLEIISYIIFIDFLLFLFANTQTGTVSNDDLSVIFKIGFIATIILIILRFIVPVIFPLELIFVGLEFWLIFCIEYLILFIIGKVLENGALDNLKSQIPQIFILGLGIGIPYALGVWLNPFGYNVPSFSIIALDSYFPPVVASIIAACGPIILLIILNGVQVAEQRARIRFNFSLELKKISTGIDVIEQEIRKNVLKGNELKIEESGNALTQLYEKTDKSILTSAQKTDVKTIQSRLEKLNNDLKNRVEILVGQIGQVTTMVDTYFTNPTVEEGNKIAVDLAEKIFVCKENEFQEYLTQLRNARQKLMSIHESILKMNAQLKEIEVAITRGQFGKALMTAHKIADSIILLKSQQLSEQFTHLIQTSQSGVDQTLADIDPKQEYVKDLIKKHDFSGARKIAAEISSQYNQLAFQTGVEQRYVRDFSQLNYAIDEAERHFKIYNTLIALAEKYPRVLIGEVATKSGVDPMLVEPIVKELIAANVIKANFDEESKGIEFKFLIDELDQLRSTFDNWQEKGFGKKL